MKVDDSASGDSYVDDAAYDQVEADAEDKKDGNDEEGAKKVTIDDNALQSENSRKDKSKQASETGSSFATGENTLFEHFDQNINDKFTKLNKNAAFPLLNEVDDSIIQVLPLKEKWVILKKIKAVEGVDQMMLEPWSKQLKDG